MFMIEAKLGVVDLQDNAELKISFGFLHSRHPRNSLLCFGDVSECGKGNPIGRRWR